MEFISCVCYCHSVMVCRFPCLVLVCYMFYFGISLVSPHVRFPSCVITAPSPNVFQLLHVACPVCVWYLSPCLSFASCLIILVCAECVLPVFPASPVFLAF
jgi:hypothetical protein